MRDRVTKVTPINTPQSEGTITSPVRREKVWGPPLLETGLGFLSDSVFDMLAAVRDSCIPSYFDYYLLVLEAIQ